VTRRPTRRTALRLLVGSLGAGLLGHLGTTLALAAQRPDRDNDGLYDDDEMEVYGTNPDVYDTDGDGVGDGEEVYLGTDPLTPAGGNAGCPAGQVSYGGVCVAAEPSSNQLCAAQGLTDCGGVCTNTLNDASNCGTCGNACSPGGTCSGGVCQGGCLALGSECVYGVNDCCGGACLYGVCRCSPPRDVCANGSTCCSGVCGGDGFCV
jgi:hypothetical protein